MPLLTEQDRWRKTGKYDLDEVRAVVPSGADVEESPRRRVDLTDCSGARWSQSKRVDMEARFLCRPFSFSRLRPLVCSVVAFRRCSF